MELFGGVRNIFDARRDADVTLIYNRPP